MAHTDADGMVRVNIEWTIEGAKGIRTGKQFGLHEQELAVAKATIKRQARPGDTITITQF